MKLSALAEINNGFDYPGQAWKKGKLLVNDQLIYIILPPVHEAVFNSVEIKHSTTHSSV